MQVVTLQAVPYQTLSVVLNGQNTQISIYQKGTTDSVALYADIFLDGAPIVTTRVCRNRIRLLLDAGYKGYQGDFVMVDTTGNEQPTFDGLGSRFLLYYLTPDELAGN